MTVIIPIRVRDTGDILYGSRETSYRYEVLTHRKDGVDDLAGFLDGVKPDTSLQWSWNAAVKGSGTLVVQDLADATAGMMTIAEVDTLNQRIRPVLVIDGLPDQPLGIFIFTAAPGEWTGTGRTYKLEMHDKASVLDQDLVDQTFTADDSQPIIMWVREVIQSAGETISIDAAQTARLASPRVWDVGTSKLTIVNDLLDAIGYNSLQVDGQGNFLATRYVKPAARSIKYDVPELSDLDRELVFGDHAIYTPEWTWDRDQYKVPNKVVAVANSGGDTEPVIGVATNTDPDSPYSYQARGRWITKVLTGVDVPDGTVGTQTVYLANKASQSLIASSSPQASTQVKHLPIPIRVGDVLRFENTPAGIDARHVVTAMQLQLTATGLMSSTLQEVIDL